MTYKTEYDTAHILDELHIACKKARSKSAFARIAGVSPSYVDRVLKGYDKPGPAIFTALGYRQRVIYEKVQ